ncbi:MAG: hypothetical protein ACTH36_09375 [Pseudoalteromonas nigrifaciens]
MDAHFTNQEVTKLNQFTRSISSSRNKSKCKNVTGVIDKTTKKLTFIAGEVPHCYIYVTHLNETSKQLRNCSFSVNAEFLIQLPLYLSKSRTLTITQEKGLIKLGVTDYTISSSKNHPQLPGFKGYKCAKGQHAHLEYLDDYQKIEGDPISKTAFEMIVFLASEYNHFDFIEFDPRNKAIFVQIDGHVSRVTPPENIKLTVPLILNQLAIEDIKQMFDQKTDQYIHFLQRGNDLHLQGSDIYITCPLAGIEEFRKKKKMLENVIVKASINFYALNMEVNNCKKAYKSIKSGHLYISESLVSINNIGDDGVLNNEGENFTRPLTIFSIDNIEKGKEYVFRFAVKDFKDLNPISAKEMKEMFFEITENQVGQLLLKIFKRSKGNVPLSVLSVERDDCRLREILALHNDYKPSQPEQPSDTDKNQYKEQGGQGELDV